MKDLKTQHPNPQGGSAGTVLARHLDEVDPVPCPCGASYRIIKSCDQRGFNLHITEIQDSIAHYHRHCTEVYTILEGTGILHCDGEALEVRPGSVVVIPPLVRHRLVSNQKGHPVKVHIVGLPAWQAEDEHFD